MTVDPSKLTPGTQIAYVPMHADGIDDPDVEFGFVTSVRTMEWGSTVVFCRYWSKYHDDLRTQANSEGANLSNIVLHESRPQADVDVAIEKYVE